MLSLIRPSLHLTENYFSRSWISKIAVCTRLKCYLEVTLDAAEMWFVPKSDDEWFLNAGVEKNDLPKIHLAND
jgi:hypothetical protein